MLLDRHDLENAEALADRETLSRRGPSQRPRRTGLAEAGPRGRVSPKRVRSIGPRLLLGLMCAFALGCKAIESPSNFRDWSADQAMLPLAKIDGDRAEVRNVRQCTYLTGDSYVPNWEDRTYDLRDLETVDYIVVPFQDTPGVAHTMLSFGFGDGDHLCVSIEIRRENGEAYQAVKGAMRQYELMYVLGDERDLVKLRTNFRNDDVYVYRLRMTSEQAREVFRDVLRRVDQLAAKPEYYHTVTNNCTTNTMAHLRRAVPGRIPAFDFRLLFPAHSDRLLFDAGLIDGGASFEEARQQAWVSGVARSVGDRADFAGAIRR